MKGSQPWSYMTLCWRGFVRWRDKLKSLYSPPQCLWSQSFAGWWLTSIQSVGLARSRDKLKSLYIYYHNAYGYQTWLGWDMQLGFSILKVTKPFDYIFLQVHVKNWIRNIFTSTMLMATQLDRVGIYYVELPSIKSQGPFTTWSCKVIGQIEYVISSLPQWKWPPNLAGLHTTKSFLPKSRKIP